MSFEHRTNSAAFAEQWRPSRRQEQFMVALGTAGVGLDALTERSTFVMPGNVSRVVSEVVCSGVYEKFSIVQYDEAGYVEMIRELERDHLQLPPADSATGIRYWEGGAGFGSGIYPADAVAGLIKTDPGYLIDFIKDSKDYSGNSVMIKHQEYLMRVACHGTSDDLVKMGNIVKLTATGETQLDEVLSALESGQRN